MTDTVTALLENFAENRRDYGRQLAVLLQKDPDSFQQAAVKYLSREGRLPSEQIVVWLLQKAGMLLELLLNPELCSMEESVVLALKVKENADRIDVLLAKALKESSDERASRILRLLAEIADNNRTLPLLIGVLRGESSQLRSKAARIFARYCQNTLFIENALQDTDPNVRAGAIEGMGMAGRLSKPSVLLEALSDPNPYVKAHATLASYRLGNTNALQMMNQMARQPDPHARVCAAFVMGEAGDPACVEMLERLRGDPDEEVREKVQQALSKLQVEDETEEPSSAAAGDQELSLDILYACVDETEQRWLRIAVSDEDGAEPTHLGKQYFCIQEDRCSIADFDLQTSEEREPVSLAYVLDCSGSMSATDIQQVNMAAIKSVNEKKPEDRIAVYKFSLDVEHACPFTPSSKRVAAVIRRRHFGLKTASRLHDTICSALDDLVAEQGFRAIVAIADGMDRGSEHSLPQVLRKSAAMGVPIFVIGFGAEHTTVCLRELADETGGRFCCASNSRELTSACASVIRALCSHVAITYRTAGQPSNGIRVNLQNPAGSGEALVTPVAVEP